MRRKNDGIRGVVSVKVRSMAAISLAVLFSFSQLAYADNINAGAAVLQTDSVSQMLGTLSQQARAVSTDKSVTKTAVKTTAKTSGTKSKANAVTAASKSAVTVMVYMNGSNLETYYADASADLKEMLSATLSDNVNVVIQTGGTKKWHTSGISSSKSQRFIIKNKALKLVDDSLGQLDITSESTIEDFISYCKTDYPAERYMLVFWDHGGGAVYGFGSDENVSDSDASLTISEIQTAVKNSGVKFDFIGFDACVMSGIETAYALKDYADYLIASEDFEPETGWSYTGWLTALSNNTSITTKKLAKTITSDFVKQSKKSGSDGILSLIDLSKISGLFDAWSAFLYANEDSLTESVNYADEYKASSRMRGSSTMQGFYSDYSLADYNMVDIISATDGVNDTATVTALKNALADAVAVSDSTKEDASMCGLSVTIPYGSESFYEYMDDIFTDCGISDTYIDFLKDFVSSYGSSFNSWEDGSMDSWSTTVQSGDWDNYDYSYYDLNEDDYEDYLNDIMDYFFGQEDIFQDMGEPLGHGGNSFDSFDVFYW